MKTVLFVPGFQENIRSRDYRKTIRVIEKRGYKVRFVDINWVRTTSDHWLKEFDKIYIKYDPKDTILAGFSFGAMVVFLSAAKRNPAELWLFSLSPYFAEDIENPSMKKTWLSEIGHRRVDAFKQLRFKKLIASLHNKTTYFYGENELKIWPDISYRYSITEKLSQIKTAIIPEGKHDVTSDAYIEAIKKTI